jgi:hypothetical protein
VCFAISCASTRNYCLSAALSTSILLEQRNESAASCGMKIAPFLIDREFHRQWRPKEC